jgi:hypothetical protein
MFKRITFIFVFVLASLSAKAQFKIESDTLYAYGYAGTSASDFIDIEAETHIYNLSLGSEVIKWVRTVNQLPDPAWTSAVCDIVSCKGTDVDTGSFLFDPNDTGKLYFHFYTKNVNASGKMVVRFSRAANPLDYVDVVSFVTAWKPLSIDKISNSITNVVPNPAKNSVIFNNDKIEHGKIEILNTLGQVVLSTDFDNHMTVDIRDYNTGIYTVKISNASYTSVSRIVKE